MKNANANVASAVQIDKPLLLNKDENAASEDHNKAKNRDFGFKSTR